MWGKLQTHGDKKNDAEVLAIAAAGAPLDVMARKLRKTCPALYPPCPAKPCVFGPQKRKSQ